LQERLGIAGAGAIACGLAATASRHGEVLLWARSASSADRARAAIARFCERLPEPVSGPHEVDVVTRLQDLQHATFLVEAVTEDHGQKASLLAELAAATRPEAVLATTTSSLSISELAHASGRPQRFLGLHVFNPVTRMELIELVFPHEADAETRARAHALCAALEKTAVEVPDIPGFVVNRLLFPYLFSAVRLMSDTGIGPADVDRCMTLGTGTPMGPIALLDYVGLDVAQAIGEAIGVEIPDRLLELVDAGSLGRKSGHGFYDYD
jgi:3-hydroxybutyryl-CoA dehydrogenase